MRELGARLQVEGMADAEAKLLPVQLDGRTLQAMEISTWMTDAGGLDVLADIPAGDGRRMAYQELAGRETSSGGRVRNPCRCAGGRHRLERVGRSSQGS